MISSDCHFPGPGSVFLCLLHLLFHCVDLSLCHFDVCFFVSPAFSDRDLSVHVCFGFDVFSCIGEDLYTLRDDY
jgi:hypothetical protein